jgi:hypothetical protein
MEKAHSVPFIASPKRLAGLNPLFKLNVLAHVLCPGAPPRPPPPWSRTSPAGRGPVRVMTNKTHNEHNVSAFGL